MKLHRLTIITASTVAALAVAAASFAQTTTGTPTQTTPPPGSTNGAVSTAKGNAPNNTNEGNTGKGSGPVDRPAKSMKKKKTKSHKSTASSSGTAANEGSTKQ